MSGSFKVVLVTTDGSCHTKGEFISGIAALAMLEKTARLYPDRKYGLVFPSGHFTGILTVTATGVQTGV